jgi:zinc protease
VNLLTRTKSAELGYAIDSSYYGIPNYNEYLKSRLAKLTRDEVNGVIHRYLRPDKLIIVAVAKDGDELKKRLISDEPSPMTYNSPKPAEITEEDKLVQKFPLHLGPDQVTVVPVGQVFE